MTMLALIGLVTLVVSLVAIGFAIVSFIIVYREVRKDERRFE